MISAICQAWEQAALVEPVARVVLCRTAILLDGVATGDAGQADSPRFAYVSVASPIEQLLGESTQVVDRSGSQLAIIDLAERLLDDEVAAILAPRSPSEPTTGRAGVAVPKALFERRSQLREQHVLARFLLRQIGLEEVSSHRGAPAQLYTDVAALWSLDLSMCIDPAMLLTLGADRQRYVDVHFTDRATDRLPRALGRLHDLGVRSYPRLVIV